MLNSPKELRTNKLKRQCSNNWESLHTNDSFKIIIPTNSRIDALGAPVVSLNKTLKMDSSIRMTTCSRNWLCQCPWLLYCFNDKPSSMFGTLEKASNCVSLPDFLNIYNALLTETNLSKKE